MSNSHYEYQAIIAAAAQISHVGDTGILVDTDGMKACFFRVSSTGSCTVEATCEEASREDFFEAAGRACGGVSGDALYAACEQMRGGFKRFLRRDRSGDEPLPDIPGCSSLGCSALDAVYERDYAGSLRTLVEQLRRQAGDGVPVILVGRLAAFYPAEHTVRQLLTFMPFSPVVDGLVTAPGLAVRSSELVAAGTAILQERENAKKRLAHNVMLRFKRMEGDVLADYLHILASKGSDITDLEIPIYSDAVLVCAEDPIMLFADSEPYELRLPDRVLSGREFAVAQFALGATDGVPELLVRTESGVTRMGIDPKIYTEE